jgi:hypothetical protein
MGSRNKVVLVFKVRHLWETNFSVWDVGEEMDIFVGVTYKLRLGLFL